MRLIASLLIVCLSAGIACAADVVKPPREVDPALEPVADDPKLPRVMLIGDSISMGYTLPVREALKSKANIHRPPSNCGDTDRGIKNLDTWLGKGKWDVIHFNFGLHDLKYLDESGKYVDPDKGKQVAGLEQYEKNLRQIVGQMKKTGAKLVWASTTPVPAESAGRVKGDEVRYNAVAAKVMKENGIPMDDLHAIVIKQPDLQLPKNVHFTKDGYKALAASVSGCIETALKP